MAVSFTPVFVQTPKVGLAQILDTDGTNLITLVTGGASGSKIVGIAVADKGGDAPNLELYVTRSGTSYHIGSSMVGASYGIGGAISWDAFFHSFEGLPVDSSGQKYFLLESGDTLDAAVTSALARGPLHLMVIYGDY